MTEDASWRFVSAHGAFLCYRKLCFYNAKVLRRKHPYYRRKNSPAILDDIEKGMKEKQNNTAKKITKEHRKDGKLIIIYKKDSRTKDNVYRKGEYRICRRNADR